MTRGFVIAGCVAVFVTHCCLLTVLILLSQAGAPLWVAVLGGVMFVFAYEVSHRVLEEGIQGRLADWFHRLIVVPVHGISTSAPLRSSLLLASCFFSLPRPSQLCPHVTLLVVCIGLIAHWQTVLIALVRRRRLARAILSPDEMDAEECAPLNHSSSTR